MKKLIILTFLTLLFAFFVQVSVTSAQLGGEELPDGVTDDDVYDVASEMYCDVCAGVPLSTCASVTCFTWRQEIADLLGEGYTKDEIKELFAENYGDDVTGVPLKEGQRNFALGIPALLAVIAGILIIWQIYRLVDTQETSAMRAARSAGILTDWHGRPVPDNVDETYLERFLELLEEQA